MFVLVACLATTGRGAVEDLDAFAALPVQEGGRVMPLDTLARLRLLQFSGKSTYAGRPALDWLARLLFTPERAHDDRVLLVNHPEVAEAMGVQREGRRFSFNELSPGMGKLNDMAQPALALEDEQRSAVEKEIVRLYHNLSAYLELFHSCAFAFPHEDFKVEDPAVLAKLGLSHAQALSFFDVFQTVPAWADELAGLEQTASESWSPLQRGLFALSSQLFAWSRTYAGLPLTLIPVQGHGEERWVSPWDVMSLGLSDETMRGEVASLQAMARAYVAGSQLEFDLAAHGLQRSVVARAEPSRGLRHLNLELMYNRLDLFYRAELLYGLAFLFSLAFMLAERPWLRKAAGLFVLLALAPHTAGVVMRMVMMGRPPVTNLFATFLFVAWVCVVLGLAVERFQRNALGYLLAGVSGLLLLLLSGRFAGQGDTLGVMIAVLDSNFWLSTHVIAITIGYAGCVAAGVAGHIYLLQALRHPAGARELEGAGRAVYGLLAFGLIFSFLGTMLGGVWADQSWGRFWGWDPKENGALLIVLWCTLLLHARVSRLIGPLGLAAGAVFGVVVVLMAWLGINLLGVGLHSYGFTSGMALGFWSSVALELAFIGITYPLASRRTLRAGAEQVIPDR